MYKINPKVLFVVLGVATCLVLLRAYTAISDYISGEANGLLGFPLAVALPYAALLFLASQRALKSAEGVLMQLGTLILILLILALPDLSLHLALGLPVVFLAVEVFEQRMPDHLRNIVKDRLIT